MMTQRTVHSPKTSTVSARVLDSQRLFGREKIITIQHGEQAYQLRITKENKLILTK